MTAGGRRVSICAGLGMRMFQKSLGSPTMALRNSCSSDVGSGFGGGLFRRQ
jgi:hypothetical protein